MEDTSVEGLVRAHHMQMEIRILLLCAVEIFAAFDASAELR